MSLQIDTNIIITFENVTNNSTTDMNNTIDEIVTKFNAFVGGSKMELSAEEFMEMCIGGGP